MLIIIITHPFPDRIKKIHFCFLHRVSVSPPKLISEIISLVVYLSFQIKVY